MLLKLYRSILVPVLSEWLCDASLCALDSAVCNGSLREVLLSLFKQSSIFIFYLKKESVYWWAQLKGLRIKQAHFNFDYYTVQLKELLMSIPEYDFIDAWYNYSIEDHLKGKRIRHLKLYHNNMNLKLPHLSKSLETVRVLDFRVMFPRPKEYPLIVDYAPNLEVLYLSELDNLNGLSVFNKVQVIKETKWLSSRVASCLKYTVRSLPAYYDSDEKLPSWVLCVDGVAYELIALQKARTNTPSEEELQYLTPYMERIQSVSISASCDPLIDRIIQKCHQLVSFTAESVTYQKPDLVSVFTHSAHSLTTISLCELSGTSINCLSEGIQRCSSLSELTLNRVDLSSADVELIYQSCRRLAKCEVSSTQADFTPSTMAVDLDVVKFTFSTDGTKLIETDGQRKLITHCNLHEDEMFFQLNTGLTNVHFMHMQLKNELPIQWMVQWCPLLRVVEIDSPSDVSMDVLQSLSTCKSLTSLTLTGVHGVSDECLEQFLCDKPYFAKLCLRQCSGFTGEVMKIIAKHCRHVRFVTITRHTSIYDEEVVQFINSCPTLRVLSLQGCSPVNESLKKTFKVLTFYDSL